MRELLGYQRNQPLDKAVEEIKNSSVNADPSFGAVTTTPDVSAWENAFDADLTDKQPVVFPLGDSVSAAYAESSL
jgi:hypothetical protein